MALHTARRSGTLHLPCAHAFDMGQEMSASRSRVLSQKQKRISWSPQGNIDDRASSSWSQVEEYSNGQDISLRELRLLDQINQLRAALEKIIGDNRRLEAERARMLAVFQSLHKELCEARDVSRTANESHAALKAERDRIQRAFQAYRDSRELQFSAVEKAKRLLEQRLTSLGIPLPSDEKLDKLSLTRSMSAGSNRFDLFGSCVSLNPFGSIATFASADYDRVSEMEMAINTTNSSVSIFDNYPSDSPLSSTAVVRLLYFSAPTSDEMASVYEREHLPTIRQTLNNRNRLCEFRHLNYSTNYNGASLLIVFDKDDLTVSDKEEIKNRIVEDDNCLLAVFCSDGSPPGDGFWEHVLGSPKTRLCHQAEDKDRLQSATDEIVQFLISELDSDTTSDEHSGYQLCRSIANGDAFCPYASGAVSRALLTQAASRHEDAWVARDQLNEALRHHLHSPGPLAPLLIRGSKTAGVTGALAKWLVRTKEALAPNLLVLYHQALDQRSLTADACLMLRQFCKQLKTHAVHMPTRTATDDSTVMNTNELKRYFLELLELVGPQFTSGVLIAIDGLDRIDDFIGGQLTTLSWLFEPQPVDTRIIVTVGDRICANTKILERCAHWPSVMVTPLSVRESLILLRSLLPEDIESGFVDLMAAQLGSEQLRSPAVIQAFGRFFAQMEVGADRATILHDLLSAGAAIGTFDTLLSLLLDYCNSRLKTIDSAVVSKLLGFIACSTNGLSENELLDLLPTLATDSMLFRILEIIETFCGGIVCNTTGLYRIVNRQWKSAITVCSNSEDAREILHDYFAKSGAAFRICDELLGKGQLHVRADVVVSAASRGMWSQITDAWRANGLSTSDACSRLVSQPDSRTAVGYCCLAAGIYCRINQEVKTIVNFYSYKYTHFIAMPSIAMYNSPPYFSSRRKNIKGMALASCMPTIGSVTAGWASLTEAGLFIGVASSMNQLAPVFTMPLSGALCVSSLGWPGVYYVHAAVTLTLFILWASVYHEKPGNSQLVSGTELKHISDGKVVALRSKTTSTENRARSKLIVPYGRIMRTQSIWVVWLSAAVNIASMYLIILFAPTYINKVLLYSIEKTGLLAAIPTLVQFFVKILAGHCSDRTTCLGDTAKHGLESTVRLLQKSAEVFQCSLGADNPVLAFSYKEIGRCYAQFGKSALAERLYKRALSIIENSCGESSAAAEEIISFLIQVNKSQNRLKSADALGCRLKEMAAKRERSEKILKRLAMLEKRRLRLSETPETVRILTQLGMMRYYYGELDEADELFNQALDMKIKLAGGRADPLELCREWQNLAAVAARRKDWRRAIDYFRKVVEARDRKLGRTHHLTIASLRSFAQCLQRIERPGAELETVLRRLLDHYQAAGDSAQTVHTMSQLAAFYCRQGQHDRAEPLLDRALAIAQSRLPDNHPAALIAAKVHTKLHLDVGDVDKAIRLYTRTNARRPTIPPNVKHTRFELQLPPPGRMLGRRLSCDS